MATVTDLSRRLQRLEQQRAGSPAVEIWIRGSTDLLRNATIGEVISSSVFALMQADPRRRSVSDVIIDEVDWAL
jgi:hypothetical protein